VVVTINISEGELPKWAIAEIFNLPLDPRFEK